MKKKDFFYKLQLKHIHIEQNINKLLFDLTNTAYLFKQDNKIYLKIYKDKSVDEKIRIKNNEFPANNNKFDLIVIDFKIEITDTFLEQLYKHVNQTGIIILKKYFYHIKEKFIYDIFSNKKLYDLELFNRFVLDKFANKLLIKTNLLNYNYLVIVSKDDKWFTRFKNNKYIMEIINLNQKFDLKIKSRYLRNLYINYLYTKYYSEKKYSNARKLLFQTFKLSRLFKVFKLWVLSFFHFNWVIQHFRNRYQIIHNILF